MGLNRRIPRVLHDDHVAVISMLQRFTAALDDVEPEQVPDIADGGFSGLLGELVIAVDGEIADHFALEEQDLFPALEAAGEGGLGAMLTEEHDVILPLGRRVAQKAELARKNGFDIESWKTFRRMGHEFAGMLIAHAEKEEIGLVPLLDEILEPDEDAQMADAYAAGDIKAQRGPAMEPAT